MKPTAFSGRPRASASRSRLSPRAVRDHRAARLGRDGRGVSRARHAARPRCRAQGHGADTSPPIPTCAARFETEARAVAALSHPNILAIHELAIADGVPVRGDGAARRARRCANGSSAGALPVARGGARSRAAIAEGLAAAHAKGIIHRDLKPENIFLTSDGAREDPRLRPRAAARRRPADARGADRARTPATGVVLGTFGYMSPEQVTRRAGRRPQRHLRARLRALRDAHRAAAVCRAHAARDRSRSCCTSAAAISASIDPLAPAELGPSCRACLEREPERRFERRRTRGRAPRALTRLASVGGRSARRPRLRGKSLAVLPFLNAGVDAERRVPDRRHHREHHQQPVAARQALRVVPRSLVFRYKGLQADPATVGLALNARTILTGRVSQQGDVLDIQAELVDTAPSRSSGASSSVRGRDLMAVQEEIAWQISEALRLKLSASRRGRLRKRQPSTRRRTRPTCAAGIRVEQLGPRRIPPGRRALRAGASSTIPCTRAPTPASRPATARWRTTASSRRGGYPRALEAAAEGARASTRRMADAHASLALGTPVLADGLGGRRARFRTALELNPQLATARATYALYLTVLGRHDEALAQARTAQSLDPVSPLIDIDGRLGAPLRRPTGRSGA